MKSKVLCIVRNALDGASDNLNRANMQFGKMTKKELKKEYGESGRSCDNILQEYKDAEKEMRKCLSWVLKQ